MLVARAQSCENQVQHIERLSGATCVTCHMVQRDCSAIKFDRVEIAFIWQSLEFIVETRILAEMEIAEKYAVWKKIDKHTFFYEN